MKKTKKAKKPFQLSEQAALLIDQLTDAVIKSVTKHDKKSQKGNK